MAPGACCAHRLRMEGRQALQVELETAARALQRWRRAGGAQQDQVEELSVAVDPVSLATVRVLDQHLHVPLPPHFWERYARAVQTGAATNHSPPNHSSRHAEVPPQAKSSSISFCVYNPKKHGEELVRAERKISATISKMHKYRMNVVPDGAKQLLRRRRVLYTPLGTRRVDGKLLVYFMQDAPRVQDNPCLLWVTWMSAQLTLPLVVLAHVPRPSSEQVFTSKFGDHRARLSAFRTMRDFLIQRHVPLLLFRRKSVTELLDHFCASEDVHVLLSDSASSLQPFIDVISARSAGDKPTFAIAALDCQSVLPPLSFPAEQKQSWDSYCTAVLQKLSSTEKSASGCVGDVEMQWPSAELQAPLFLDKEGDRIIYVAASVLRDFGLPDSTCSPQTPSVSFVSADSSLERSLASLVSDMTPSTDYQVFCSDTSPLYSLLKHIEVGCISRSFVAARIVESHSKSAASLNALAHLLIRRDFDLLLSLDPSSANTQPIPSAWLQASLPDKKQVDILERVLKTHGVLCHPHLYLWAAGLAQNLESQDRMNAFSAAQKVLQKRWIRPLEMDSSILVALRNAIESQHLLK